MCVYACIYYEVKNRSIFLFNCIKITLLDKDILIDRIDVDPIKHYISTIISI